MDHAMRLWAIVQATWTRNGFWVGVAIILGLLAQTDSQDPTLPEIFWYRVFLPLNATLTVRMIYQFIASRVPAIAAVGAFVHLWLAWWLGHILGGFALSAVGKSLMTFSPANSFSPPFEPLGLLIVTLAGIWFVLSAIVMPLRFATAIAQEIQTYLDQRRRRQKWLASQSGSI